jgi:hypothetical protein
MLIDTFISSFPVPLCCAYCTIHLTPTLKKVKNSWCASLLPFATFYLAICSDIQSPAMVNVLKRSVYRVLMFMLLMSMGWDDVSELWLPVGLLFIPQMMYECGEPWWNGIDRAKPKNVERNLSQCHYVRLKSHMDWPACEPGPPRWEARD